MISVVVIAKNEQEMIRVCLESIKWADEIIVVLNDSSDNTELIAREFTDKIFNLSGNDFSKLRNKALEVATGDWILYIDSDERVTRTLKTEILQLITSDRYSAFAISRKNIILGEIAIYKAFWPDWVIRLLKKDKIDKWNGKVHESPVFNGELGYTKNSLIHLTHRDVDNIILKSLDYSKIDALLRESSNHPPMKGWRFLRILFTELFNQGILRRGFFGGTRGIIDSILQTFSLEITYIRLWQLQQDKPLDQVYKDIDANLIKKNFEI